MLGEKAIKTLTNKKRKLRSVIKSGDNFSDAETIQYAESYRDTSKKDEIYRKKSQEKSHENTSKEKS